MSVKRYGLIVFTNRGGERDAKMGQLVSGAWVQHKDYAALADRLRVSEAKREVERDASLGKSKARVQDRGAHALHRFLHRRIGQTHDGGLGQADRGQIGLDLARDGVDPGENKAVPPTDHAQNYNKTLI